MKLKTLGKGIIGAVIIWSLYYVVWIGFYKILYIRGVDFDLSRMLPSWVYYFTLLMATLMTVWVGVILIPEYVFQHLEERNLKKELEIDNKSR